MKRITGFVLGALLIALLTLAGCQMDLFDVVKGEVEEYRAAQAGSPEITVLKGIDEVPESGDVPIGPGIAGETKLVTFSIENLGSGSLQLTGSPRVEIGGPHALQFILTSLPASVIAAGGKSDFIIEFSPIGTGERTATILIENSASDDGEFDFSITGEGVGSAGPEIQVTTGSTVIDEVQPYTHDFGKLLSGDSAEDTFTIYNIGTPSSLLHLLGSPTFVQISGADAGMFSVTVQPDRTSLFEGDPVQDHSSFTLRYQPSAVGTHTATVSILNNDANGDEVNYTFDLTGSCFRLDVLFLLDVSGSMGSFFASAQAGISDTMSAISALDGNAAFALATLNDFPYGSWGSPPAEAYELWQSLTADINTQLAALPFPSGGNDFPGSHLEALYQGTTGEGLSINTPFVYSIPASPVGWRADALHAIVLISDSPFHNPEVDAGGYPGHTFGETITAMNSAGVDMIALSVGYGLADMQIIAEGTGGLVFPISYYETSAVMDGIAALMSQF